MSFASNSISEIMGEPLEYTTLDGIVLKEAGVLKDLFAKGSKVDLKRLTISGDMNGDDFRFLRYLLGAPAVSDEYSIESNVSEIDLTDADIVAGGGSYDGTRFTTDNEISTGLFANCRNLHIALLPNSATTLARDAFAQCESLESLTVSAGITTLIPSAGCTSLSAIEVSDANENFADVDGVLFNHEVTKIIWLPVGKTGNYTLPSTITAIGENAFFGTGITSLSIPSSVTTIARGAFAGSSLREITLPDKLTNVSGSMFQGCAPLVVVRLGKDTRYIGSYAFDGTSLTDIYVDAQLPPVVASDAFVNGESSITSGCVLHVRSGSKSVYWNHNSWGQFSRIEGY